MVGLMNTMDRPLRLDVRNVSLSFGSVHVLRGANLQVADFGITALIGANGAGKTALLNAITGIYHPQSGEILLDGDDICGETADTIAKRKVGRSFQHLELFQRLTLTENLLVFRDQFFRGSVLEQVLFLGRASRQEATQREEVEKVIDFFELWAHRDTPVKSLSYGMQKLIGFARAMVMQPKLLLLDEPASGLTREEKENLARFILRLRSDWKIPILWIEHDMDLVMDLADHVHVLQLGRSIASGSPNDVFADPEVRKSYLKTSN
jgi:branched-chain amino acid transport system ATP-binding protein